MPALPKPKDKRARRNVGGPEFRSVTLEPGAQPALPSDRVWSEETEKFWSALGDSELAREFTATEWRVLLLAALIHEEVWMEGRLTRVDQFMAIMAKFPFTPKDRQALRIQTLTGDQLEDKVTDRTQDRAVAAAQARYQGFRVA